MSHSPNKADIESQLAKQLSTYDTRAKSLLEARSESGFHKLSQSPNKEELKNINEDYDNPVCLKKIVKDQTDKLDIMQKKDLGMFNSEGPQTKYSLQNPRFRN